MRVLAVDFGEKRVGLAISDDTGGIVVPVGTVRRISDAQAASEIVAAAHERGVERLLVGLPLRPDGGGESPFAARARSFARRLAEVSGLPVDLHDEALTSHSAEGTLRGMGLTRVRRAAALDAEAAAELLRDWLSEHRGEGAP